MLQTVADQLTAQFYAWEQRGRGWNVFEEPVQLEPAFVPFFFHNLPTQKNAIIDDGKRHTLASMLLAEARKLFGNKREQPIVTAPELLIEAYPYEGESVRLSFSVSFPKGQKIPGTETEQVLLMLANCQHPISFEIVATGEKISVQYTCVDTDAPFLYGQLKAYFPTCVLIEKEDALLPIIDQELHILDFGIREEFMRPIAMQGNFDPDPLISLFGILDHLQTGEGGAVQILFAGCQNPWAESMLRAVTNDEGGAFFADAPDMLTLAKQKISARLFAVSIRAIGMSELEKRAEDIAWNIGNTLVHLSRANGNQLLPLTNDEYSFGDHLEDVLYRKTHRLGMLLNSKELATIAHYPSTSVASAKLERIINRTKAAPESARGHKLIIGTNTHNGLDTIVSLSNLQRLKHVHIIGATGTGKSTLLLQMMRQDIEQGAGIALLDPHGDLIERTLSFIPEHRANDVVLIDPADEEHPVGFNILTAHSVLEKEILSSDLVAAFRRLSTSWGDQMNSVFANAILAFLESSKGGTLADLRHFLVDKEFRATFLKTVSDPMVIYYWHKEFPLLKSNSVPSILTRLDSFLRPRLIRNMVGQTKSLDFDRFMNERKIILVKLSQGLIGAENSYLLGTFIVSKIHQAALGRQTKAQEARSDFFLYVDEFQHFITSSMGSMLSEARKYHLGLVLAHQSMQQLNAADTELASAVIANAGTRVCFRLGDTDAKKLEDGFSFFEAKDLQNLSVGEAIVRVDKPEHDFSLTTLPLASSAIPAAVQQQVIDHSRQRYGTPKAQVIAQLNEAMQLKYEAPPTKATKPIIEEEAQDEALEVPKENMPSPRNRVVESKLEGYTAKPAPVEANVITGTPKADEFVQQEEVRLHENLKQRIKVMAEQRGFKATTEASTPDGKGYVDVALEGHNRKIACEVSVTTSPAWELRNVSKCLAAGYDTVVVCSTDHRHIEKVRSALLSLTPEEQAKVFVYEPDALFEHLNSLVTAGMTSESVMKGYRVKTEYTDLPPGEGDVRQNIVKRILRKPPKKKE